MDRKNGQGHTGLGEHLTMTQSETEIFVPPAVAESKENTKDDAKKKCEYELFLCLFIYSYHFYWKKHLFILIIYQLKSSIEKMLKG